MLGLKVSFTTPWFILKRQLLSSLNHLRKLGLGKGGEWRQQVNTPVQWGRTSYNRPQENEAHLKALQKCSQHTRLKGQMILFLSLLLKSVTIPPQIQWLWLAHTLREKRTLLQVACGHFKSATKINCFLSREFVCLSFPNHLKFRVKVVSLKGQESKFPMQFTDCNRPAAGVFAMFVCFSNRSSQFKMINDFKLLVAISLGS